MLLLSSAPWVLCETTCNQYVNHTPPVFGVGHDQTECAGSCRNHAPSLQKLTELHSAAIQNGNEAGMLRLAILSHRPKDESEVLLKFRYLIGYLIVTRGNLSAHELGLISQYGQPDARHDCKPSAYLTATD